MVVVPAGEFLMGSSPSEIDARTKEYPDHKSWWQSESPQRKVTLAKPFSVGKFETTFAEWDACVAAGGCKHKPDDKGWGRGKRPAINVSWDDITKQYLPWLSRKTGKSYRLLTEAEWEYAARAGTTTRYAFGDSITKSQAQFSEGPSGSAGKTVEVGSFKANAFGLHDMHGNVWEWAQDCWNTNYQGSPVDGSAWTTGDCSVRMLRGGSWRNPARIHLRSANRNRSTIDSRDFNYGFRVARTLSP
jgi:formylglycine-generating enzyme required for sulfatase activity